MFTFILSNSEELGFNYPKYIIVLKNSDLYYSHGKTFFYYLVSPNKYFIRIPCKFPTYLILPYLYFDIRNEKDEKLDLSKLGTEYILNGVCTHLKKECKGKYPDNYVFVNEISWPWEAENYTDKTPLKKYIGMK